MSNVKVNGNTYNDVTKVKLPLADGTGYATYEEGAVADSYLDKMLSANYGDIYDERSGEIDMSFLAFSDAGTINFPNVTTLTGSAKAVAADNMLFPKVANWEYDMNNQIYQLFAYAKVSGVLDLSGLAGGSGNQTFMYANIGTLKLGKLPRTNGVFSNAKITNLIWNNPDLSVDDMTGSMALGSNGAVITNAYVRDDLYDGIKAEKDAGALTTVTNLHKISEWSDE